MSALWFRGSLRIATLVLCLTAAGSAKSAEPVQVSQPDGVGDWAVHEETGRVFASLAAGDEVVEYDFAGKEVQKFKVGAQPGEMLIKGERLIVGCKKTPALHVIDLKTNKSLGSIALTGNGPYGLFCSQVANGFVYAICNTGDAWWDGEIFQCDLSTMKLRKRRKVQGWDQSHPIHVAMSPDGKWIIPDARGASSPSGADLMKVSEDEFTFTFVRDYHESFGQIVAAPHNRHWTFGDSLYSLDITKNIRKFAGSPVAIHPRLDLAVSKTANGLSLQRFSDAGPIATVALQSAERATPRRQRDFEHAAFDTTIQFDLKNNRVFCGERLRGTWVDLSAYQADLTPLLMVQAPSEVQSLVGKPLRIPLPVTNGGNTAKLSLVDAPKGARIEKDHFVWQPGAEDVGFTTVRIELKSAKGDRTLDAIDMTLHITLPKIELGFHSRSMALSPNGRYLLVWGQAAGGERERHPAEPGSDEIAVLDLQEVKVLTRKTLPQGVRCATIDDDFVFVAPNSGNLVYRFNRALADSQRVFLQSAPAVLLKMGKQRLVALGEQAEFIDTQTMKRAEGAPNTGNLRFAEPAYGLLENEIAIGNQLFDRETGEVIRPAGMVQLPLLFSNRNRRDQRFDYFERQMPTQWGRRLQGGSLTNYKGSPISQFAGQRSGMISQRWPMAIMIGTSHDGRTTTTTLELANLIDGKIEHSSIINVSAEREERDFYGTRNQMLMAGDQLVLLRAEEVLLVTIPPSVAKAMPTPTYFKPLPTTELEVGAPAKIKLAMGGKTEGVTLNLLTEYPGVTLDAKTNELSIDTTVLWNAFIKQLGAPDEDDDLAPAPGFGRDLAEAFANNAKQYKESLGKYLAKGKFATQLPITAVLHDAEGQEDRLHFRVVVLGPRKQLDDALAAREAAVEKQMVAAQEAYKKEQEARAKAAAGRVPMPGQPNRTPEARLDDLETRMRRIEAALDSILKKLDER